MSEKDRNKAARERLEFEAFAQAAQLRLGPGAIESRPPPEPDILYTPEPGVALAFEICRVADEAFARSASYASHDGVSAYTHGTNSFPGAFRRKLGRHYTSPHPIHLLCVLDGDFRAPDFWVATMRSIIDGAPAHCFASIWLFSLGEGTFPVWPSDCRLPRIPC